MVSRHIRLRELEGDTEDNQEREEEEREVQDLPERVAMPGQPSLLFSQAFFCLGSDALQVSSGRRAISIGSIISYDFI